MNYYHNYYIYILASCKNGTIYIGMTNDLSRRISEHKRKEIKGFTAKYNVDKLVYVEHFKYVGDAISREKQLKGWNRRKKIELIEKDNYNWNDLSDLIIYGIGIE